MAVKFLESEKSNGALLVSWQADCATVFNEILGYFRAIIPEAKWSPVEKMWVVPKECAYAYHQVKQRYVENDVNTEPLPFKKSIVFTYNDDVNLCIGLQSPPGLFFEIKDISFMVEKDCLKERLIHLEENRSTFIAAARLHQGERRDIAKEDLVNICNAQWASEQLKSKARSELSYRKEMEWRGKGYIYVIQSQGLYKIGMTGNLADRLKAFKTSLPGGMRPIRTKLVDHAGKAETFLHEKFAGKRLNGEWFNLSEEDVAWIKKWDGIYEHQNND